jgi:hypothetical protein
VIVARPGKPKIVVLGFHPALSAMRYELSTPLLFANLLRWMAPGIFRRWELTAGSVGTVKVALDPDVRPADRARAARDGNPAPFTLRGQSLEFFSGTAGTVRVTGRRSRICLLADAAAARGIPSGMCPRKRAAAFRGSPRPCGRPPILWQWLALAGGAGLLAEWILYGRFRRSVARVSRRPVPMKKAAARRPGFEGRRPRGSSCWRWPSRASPFYESKVALAILADTSASVTPQDLDAASARGDRGREEARPQLDGRCCRSRAHPRNPAPPERTAQAWKLAYSAGQAAHGTNLEAAVRAGLATLPAGLVPRVLLISDGNENLGSVTRAIWQAQQRGVPIDVIPLAGRPRPGLVLESVSMPAQVFSGERFPVDITLRIAARRASHVELTAEGKPLGASHVQPEPPARTSSARTPASTPRAPSRWRAASAPARLGGSAFR